MYVYIYEMWVTRGVADKQPCCLFVSVGLTALGTAQVLKVWRLGSAWCKRAIQM